jgi:hypothetical protein
VKGGSTNSSLHKNFLILSGAIRISIRTLDQDSRLSVTATKTNGTSYQSDNAAERSPLDPSQPLQVVMDSVNSV